MMLPAALSRGPRQRRACAGFSLVEMVVSLSIMSTLMVGIGSAVLIATKALPGKDRPAAATLDAAKAADGISAELAEALTVTEATPTAVTFTVPDRDGDSNPETIRYAWTGVAGDPLTRSYKGGAAVSILPSVSNFALTYVTHSVTTTTTQNVTATSAESALATFDGWPLVAIPTIGGYSLSTSSWPGESFSIALPAYCTKVNFTRCKLKLKSSAPSATFTVSVYHNSGGGSPIPQTPILGNATFSSSILTSSYAWVDLAFSGVTDTAPNTGYALVVSGSASAAAVVEYYSNGGSNSNGVMMDTTTNAGTNWSNQGDSKDVLFYMYGTFETVTPTTVTITIKYLDRAAVALQTGSAGATRVMTEVEALNAPVVP